MTMNYSVRRMVRLLSSIFLMLDLTIASGADIPPPPTGWEGYPQTKRCSFDHWREESDVRYLVAFGDFDGDGTADNASIFVRRPSKEEGLFVYLSGRSRWIELAHAPMVGQHPLMGVDVQAPGRISIDSCLNVDENGNCIYEISPPYASIIYFRPGSASRLFWIGRDGVARMFWLSD